MASGSTAMDGFLEVVIAAAVSFAPPARVVRARVKPNPEDADRTSDVLDALVAEILECDVVQPVTDLIAHRTRNTDAARLGEHLEPRRHVDAVAKDVVVLNDHVAEIDADAELHPSRRRDIRVASRHPALNLGRAQHGVGNAMELDEHAVAGGLDDAAVVLGDGRIDQLDPMGLETRKRARLVNLHESAVADHVGGKDRCEPSLWSRHVHLAGSSTEQMAGSLTDANPLPKLACAGNGPPPPHSIPSACM